MANSREPKALRRGKRFQDFVQAAMLDPDDPSFGIEATVNIEYPPELAPLKRRGRMDVYFDLSDGSGAAIFEIKATDWDKVKHLRRLLGAHRRQVMKYVDQYVMHRNVSVCAFIVYPRRPRRLSILKEVEDYMDEAAIKIHWFEDDNASKTP